MKKHAGSGALYGMGFLGVAVYFIQHATTLGEGILGLIKAVFWPALITYRVFEILKF